MSAGLITIAYGPHKYMRMAEALALSYRRWNPKLPFCVVTDQANAERLAGYYDVVRIIDPSYGKGVAQKLCVDRYSPFDETLFVDSDCVFYHDPALTWNGYAIDDFVIAQFLTGANPTMPVYIYGLTRFVDALPLIMALGTILVTISVTLLIIAEYFRRRGVARASLKDTGGFL